MQPLPLKRLTSAACVFALTISLLQANETNPYAAIVDRNPFGLKPPPPKPPAPDQTAPPVPMAKVTLTGLISSFGEPRALFEIVEDAAKGGTSKKPILREGEREGAVEVLAIDVVKNSVRIRNSGVETNVTFEIAKSSGPAPGGSGVPGAPPKLAPPPALSTPTPPPQVSATGPTIISPNSADTGGGGVTLVGGASANPVNTPLGSLGGATGYNPAGGYNNAGAYNTQPGGTPAIPPRPLRTEAAAVNNNPPPMTRDQAALLIEARRLEGRGPPLPPTHLTPIMEGVEGENAQPPPSAFPQFPPRTPPGLPRR